MRCHEIRSIGTIVLALWVAVPVCALAQSPPKKPRKYYLPSADSSRLVTVTKTGNAEKEITVLTEAVAVKETGPKETVARFG